MKHKLYLKLCSCRQLLSDVATLGERNRAQQIQVRLERNRIQQLAPEAHGKEKAQRNGTRA